jgi:hypothetical protein
VNSKASEAWEDEPAKFLFDPVQCMYAFAVSEIPPIRKDGWLNIYAKQTTELTAQRNEKKLSYGPWQRGIVVIASAYRTEDPGFESRQGVRVLGIYTLQCCCHNLICIVIVCT